MTQTKSLAVLMSDQKFYREGRVHLIKNIARCDTHLAGLRKRAIEAVKNGETTGNKLRDAIVAVIGYSEVSIERHLHFCLHERGGSAIVEEPITFTKGELALIETFRKMPALFLKPEIMNILARVFKIDETPSAQREMDEALMRSKTRIKLSSPFPGMGQPWSRDKKLELAAVLLQYPPHGVVVETSAVSESLPGNGVVQLEKWENTHSDVPE